MRSKKSLNAPVMYPKFSGVPSTIAVARAHVVDGRVERLLHAHVDAVDRVVVGAGDDRVGHRLAVPPEREWKTTSSCVGLGHGDRLALVQKPDRSNVRCSRTSPTWSTMMWRRSKRQSSPARANVSR